MKETAEKLFRGIDELMELTMVQVGVLSVLEMDDTSIKAMKLSMELMKTSKELTMECVEMMEEQDKKLNRILYLLEKQEKRA